MALGYMRRHRRWLFGFLWVVIAAFIIFYIPAFLDTGKDQQDVVARVGKGAVGAEQFRRAVLDWRRNFERQSGQHIDMRTIERRGIPERVLQGLVEEILIEDEAKRLDVSVDDAALQQAIVTTFQRDGRFIGGAEVRRLLELRDMSEAQFLSQLRAQLLRERLETLVTAGVDVEPSEVEREYRRRNEQVKLEYALVDSARFRAEITPSPEEVKAYFDAHADTYRLPERRVVSYGLISQEALAKEVAVTERDAKAYYQDNLDDFTTPEQACASHILVKVKTSPADTQGHDDAQARTIAEGLLAQVKKGADFTALAKKSSEDPGSATNGGDLGCFGHGQMVPQFDQAVFSMTPEQVSDLVKTPFGYHIIKLKELRKEQAVPLEQARARIEQILRQQKARQRLDDKVMAVTAALSKGESLEKVAPAQGLTLQKTAPFALGGRVTPLSAEAVAAAFELKQGQTRPAPVAIPGGALFVALAAIEAPRAPELKDVEGQVRSDLIEGRGLEKAQALAQQLTSRARSEGLEKAARGLGLARKETPSLVGRGQPMGELGTNILLDQAAFGLELKKISDPVRVAAGYAVLGLLEKKPFDQAAFAKEKDGLADSLRGDLRRKVFEAFLAEAAERYGVERTAAFHKVFGEAR
jgi:peptidyl-prolyl cis-trans isomerase D